ncbi:MAG: hypothetical protein HOV77_01480 [Hamadaea sp.]|uniref:wHTH domain-containing protein n=1 Tax=Hamadaea sp. TaxID=2024425 RepID=UPI00182FDE7B|nr:caspase family protein [Hamadaea sp.]NUT17834.1 hypothetical protein [Hamadaea sp.]
MTARHALLIGVPHYDASSFSDIADVVESDVLRISESLGQSGYQIGNCGYGDPSGQEATGSRIRAAISRACSEVPEGGVLLIYFSGHGLTVDGESYLAPCDTYLEPNGIPDVASLVALLPRRLENCRAGMIVLAVDACRDQSAGAPSSEVPAGALRLPGGGSLVLVNACRPGQRSLYSDTGSYFTQALAEALDRRNPARTLQAVLDEATRQMSRKARRVEAEPQEIDVVWVRTAEASDPATMEICAGDLMTDLWRRAVEDSPLWTRAVGSDADRMAARSAVMRLLTVCSNRWTAAQAALAARADLSDPWTDTDYPIRFIARLGDLLSDCSLPAGEVATLLAVPFLREILFAGGVREAAAIAPADFRRTYADGARSDLELTHAIHEHVCRRAEGLAKRGARGSHDAVAMWLVHRWLANRRTLWRSESAMQLCKQFSSSIIQVTDGLRTEAEVAQDLRSLLGLAGGDVDPERLGRLRPRASGLAAVLATANVLAFDPRCLPPVIVDHLGISAELSVPAVRTALARARWRRADDGSMDLHAVCDHPALHDAFQHLVEAANLLRKNLSDVEMDASLAAALPAKVTASGLRPEIQDERPAYKIPLSRFRLSDDKVRELLMGRQVYGDSSLAIRELYQNALDACRYRRTRREYVVRTSGCLSPWQGAIKFVQGVENGRAYIDCEDNGVGMDEYTLAHTFATAGERFVYRPEFRQEQAGWQELDPPLRMIPNSQFGVGVFSYFMLADEIEIHTRPVGRDDIIAGQAFSVRIASSGSLFQVTPSREIPAGGTRVRLYLTQDEPTSVLRALRSLLWVSEFAVTASEVDVAAETWEPEQLRYSGGGSEPLRVGDDLWWVDGGGGLAADGLRTGDSTYGSILNLRGQNRPQLTIDRNKIRSWNADWGRDQMERSLPDLMAWPGLTLHWLWQVTNSSPVTAQMIFEEACRRRLDLTIGGPWGQGLTASIMDVGCLPVDEQLFQDSQYSLADRWWMIVWRSAVWNRKLPGLIPAYAEIPSVARLDGYPVVEPRDALALTDLDSAVNYLSRVGRPEADDLVDSYSGNRALPYEDLQRLRRFAIAGLDLRSARDLPSVRIPADLDDAESTEMRMLLRALPAAIPVGSSRRAHVAPLLAASARGNWAVREVHQRLGRLLPDGWQVEGLPARRAPGVLDEVASARDVRLLSVRLNGRAPWVGPEVSPAHVVAASDALGWSIEEVRNRIRSWGSEAIQVVGDELYPAVPTVIEREALRLMPSVGAKLSAFQIFAIACRSQSTTGEVVQGLSRLHDARLIDLDDVRTLPDLLPTQAERESLQSRFVIFDSAVFRGVLVDSWHVVVSIFYALLDRPLFGPTGRFLECRNLIAFACRGRRIGAPELILASWYLDLSIRDTAAVIARLDLGLEFDDGFAHCEESVLDALPNPTPEFMPKALLGSSVVTWRTSQPKWNVTAYSLVSTALEQRRPLEEVLSAVEPYRVLGAPLPVLDPERHSSSVGDVDACDAAILADPGPMGIGTNPVSTITPLSLVRAAGRFGWTVKQAHQRFERLAPLGLTLEYDPSACSDEIVRWQDLLILTEFHDGFEPAISGTPTEEHIAGAMEHTDESPEWIVDRLRHYAELFSLTVDGERAG